MLLILKMHIHEKMAIYLYAVVCMDIDNIKKIQQTYTAVVVEFRTLDWEKRVVFDIP